MKTVIRMSATLALLSLYLFYLYVQCYFVNELNYILGALLLYLLMYPYFYFFSNSADAWSFTPIKDNKPFKIIVALLLIINIFPTIVYYFIMCSEAFSWSANAWNGNGRLDAEGNELLSIFTFLWIMFLFFCYLVYFVLLLVFVKNRKKTVVSAALFVAAALLISFVAGVIV